jgi:hypothetical protein
MKFKRRHSEFKQGCVLGECYAATDTLPPILPACRQLLLPACMFITRDTVCHPRCFLFRKFVHEPICLWWEAFVNRGSTIYCKSFTGRFIFPIWLSKHRHFFYRCFHFSQWSRFSWYPQLYCFGWKSSIIIIKNPEKVQILHRLLAKWPGLVDREVPITYLL